MQAPKREVTRIVAVEGPRGGVLVVHVLTCGHWVTRRRPALVASCIGCVVAAALAAGEK